MDWMRWVRAGCAGTLVGLLAACGGGGGGSDAPAVQAPPSRAAALASSEAEAIGAVQAAVGGAAQIAGQSSSASNLFLSTGPLGVRSGVDMVARARTSGREAALDVQSVGCADFVDPPCSGSITVNASFDLSSPSDSVPAGSRLTLSFNDVQGSIGGVPIAIDGALRFDFVTAFDAANLANTELLVTSDELQGTADGQAFGPETSALLMEFDAQSRLTLTADGIRLSEVSSVVVDGAEDFSIGTARLRRAHWRDADAYVDCRFNGWVVAAAHAALNSQATFTAGSDRIVVAVTGSSVSTVTYQVAITVGGVTTTYVVTATYAADGTPTYSAEAT